MEKKREITVNRLPARTWNWLRMNESRADAGETRDVCRAEWETEGEGLLFGRQARGIPFGKDPLDNALWASVETGMGREMESLFGEPELLAAAPGRRGEKPALAELKFSGNAGNRSRIHLYAGRESELSVAAVCVSDGMDSVTAALQIKIYAEEGARVRVYAVQLLGRKDGCLCDVSGVCEAGASIELVKLELGAGTVYSGGLFCLLGDGSRARTRIGYSGKGGQRLDMNYIARHQGKRSESRIEVSGVLEDGAFKLFRGTIDFLPGCSASRGTEAEDVLLLGEDMVNQTVPLILCGEEDVEGNHGATIGRMDDRTVFYLASRGIPEEAAKRMMARARIDALLNRIPVPGIGARVWDCLEGRERDEKY